MDKDHGEGLATAKPLPAYLAALLDKYRAAAPGGGASRSGGLADSLGALATFLAACLFARQVPSHVALPQRGGGGAVQFHFFQPLFIVGWNYGRAIAVKHTFFLSRMLGLGPLVWWLDRLTHAHAPCPVSAASPWQPLTRAELDALEVGSVGLAISQGGARELFELQFM